MKRKILKFNNKLLNPVLPIRQKGFVSFTNMLTRFIDLANFKYIIDFPVKWDQNKKQEHRNFLHPISALFTHAFCYVKISFLQPVLSTVLFHFLSPRNWIIYQRNINLNGNSTNLGYMAYVKGNIFFDVSNFF